MLDVQGSKALLISKYGLDIKKYHSKRIYDNLTWEKCDLRKWLNNDFLKTAFSNSEKKGIIKENLSNSYRFYDSYGGNDTQDYVFVLSVDEAEKYLIDQTIAKLQATAYADAKEHNRYLSYWLRSPGRLNDDAAIVEYGKVDVYGAVTTFDHAVRPSVWIDLTADCFQ